MSSWDPYIDKIMGINGVTCAGIYGIDGLKWGSTPDFPLTSRDIVLLVSGISNFASLTNGITVNSERFIPVRSDGEQFCCLKKNLNGIIAYKCNKCIIVVMHDDTVKLEHVCPHLGVIRDFLFNNGY
ncbi:hypothetical protein GJ496_009458 [Pomphorhynchus laevis]|nr:hypothetical protein GJ496_009458 [Pomphorhynchus laevis]